jgi:hypothetical protein
MESRFEFRSVGLFLSFFLYTFLTILHQFASLLYKTAIFPALILGDWLASVALTVTAGIRDYT